MGCVLGLLGTAACSGLACCCTGAAVSCCCHGCCSCKNSTSTRIVYTVLLFLGVLTGGIFLIPDLQPQLAKVPSLCDDVEHFNRTTGKWEGPECLYSVSAIYRLFFALTIFFALMSVIMIDVQSSRDCRAAIQNGLWFLKLASVIGLAVGAFHMPHSFPMYWMYICIAASTLYIIIQLILTIDFAFYINEYLGERHEDTNGRCFLCIQFSTMAICYGLALAMVVLLFVFYTAPDDCDTNKIILGVNIAACMIFSCLSVMSKVQEKVNQSGLLQSSIISLYVMFITWTAFSNQPDKACNPGIKNILVHGKDKENYEINEDANVHLKPENILAIIFSGICVLYSALRNSSESNKIFGSNNNADDANATPANAEEGVDKKKERGKAYDDEVEETTYSYSFFHFIMCLASMYTTMCLTNWIDPTSVPKSESFYGNNTAFWFKVVSSWICALLYTWSLLAPFIMPERDFS